MKAVEFYINKFNKNKKKKVITSQGFQALEENYYFAQFDMEVKVFFVYMQEEEFSKELSFGKYDIKNHQIIINLMAVHSHNCPLDYVVMHEAFHKLQHYVMWQETGKYDEDIHCTPAEEEVYFHMMEHDCISLESYAMWEPCEMGAELFCLCFDYNIDIDIRPDLDLCKIEKYFLKNVINKIPAYSFVYNYMCNKWKEYRNNN